jgi:hypothetical protein
MAVKHSKVSGKVAPVDTTLVGGPDWDDPHVIDAGTITATELATDAVTTIKVADLNITTGKLAAAAVTLAKMAALAAGRFIGRLTGSGDPEALTGTQATTLLDAFTQTLKGLVPPPVSAPSGRVLTDNGTWASISVASQDWLGDGSDGSPTFDGSTTVLGMVPVANVYTMLRDYFFDAPIVNVGVTVKTAGFSGVCKGVCTLNGIIERNGNAAANSTGAGPGTPAAALTGGRLPGGAGGATGMNSNGAGQAAGNVTGCPQGYTTSGGTGGTGGANAGGLGGTCTEAAAGSNGWRMAFSAMQGRNLTFSALALGGGGGSGGCSAFGSPSGAGGGSGAWLTWGALSFAGTGSIQARGGAGGNAHAGGGNAGGGGGGKGGIAVVVYVTGTAPTISVIGGAGGTGAGTGTAGAAGGDGISLPLKLGI